MKAAGLESIDHAAQLLRRDQGAGQGRFCRAYRMRVRQRYNFLYGRRDGNCLPIPSDQIGTDEFENVRHALPVDRRALWLVSSVAT